MYQVSSTCHEEAGAIITRQVGSPRSPSTGWSPSNTRQPPTITSAWVEPLPNPQRPVTR